LAHGTGLVKSHERSPPSRAAPSTSTFRLAMPTLSEALAVTVAEAGTHPSASSGPAAVSVGALSSLRVTAAPRTPMKASGKPAKLVGQLMTVCPLALAQMIP
jgi:hypothetical protein